MKIFFSILIFSSSIGFAKINLDKSMLQMKIKRTVSQLSHLSLAQERFDSFLKCGSHGKNTLMRAKEEECLQDQFYDEQSPDLILTYLGWLQSESTVSMLYECEGKIQEVSQSLMEKPKDVVYCIKMKTQEVFVEGFVYFRVKGENLKILKLKI
jgi:hypothetical protein